MERNEWKKAENREMNLSELMWKIIRGWRVLLVFMVVFAVLLSGYKYSKDCKTDSSATEVKVSVDDLMEQLTEKDKRNLDLVSELEKMRDMQKKYRDESILMNLDAYQKNVVTIEFYVDTHYIYNYTKDVTPDYSSALVNGYISYIENKGILSAVCKKIGNTNNEQYIGELNSAGSRVAIDGNQIDAADTSTKVFAVYITGTDMDAANELADAVTDVIKNYKSVLEQQVGSHDLVQVDRYESVVADGNLATKQSDLNEQITTLQNRIDAIVATFTSEQNQIYEYNEDNADGDSSGEAVSVSISKKFIFLGAFVGLFLGCCWIAAVYIFDRKVKSSEELQDVYGMRIFGDMTIDTQKKRLFSAADHWIDKLQHKEQWTAEEQKDLILANITATCKKEAINQVFLTTSLHLNEQEKMLTEELMEAIRNEGITVTFGENVARNAKSLEQMSEIAEVILIERTGITEYTSLEKELNLCVQQKADVLGAITLI